jgi:hypothetical protein
MSTSDDREVQQLDHLVPPGAGRVERRNARAARLLTVGAPLAAASALVVTTVLNTVTTWQALAIKYPDKGGD